MLNHGKRNQLVGVLVLILVFGIIYFIAPSVKHHAAEEFPDVAPQLAELEGYLETHLAMYGEPPKTWKAFLDFYTQENRLDPTAPRIDPKAWTYEIGLQKDFWSDPSDPTAKGIGWRVETDPTVPATPSGLNYQRRWVAQARGLIVRLRHRREPHVQMVKWLPLQEQISMAKKADAAGLVRLLDAWYDNVPGDGAAAAFVEAIFPTLESALKHSDRDVKRAAIRCTAMALKQTVAFDRSGKSATTANVLGLIRSFVRTADGPDRITSLKALYALPAETWSKVMNEWMNDPESRLRAVVIAAFTARWDYFDSDEYYWRPRSTYIMDPPMFKKLRSDPDRTVQLELLRLMGKRASRFAGSNRRSYLGEDSLQHIVLQLLSGQDEEAQIAFLESLDWQGYHYMLTVGAEEKTREELKNMLEALCSHSNVIIRRHALRVRMGGENWRPSDFEQVAPLLESDDPDNLRVAGKALLSTIAQEEPSIPCGKDAFLERALSLEDRLLVAFLGLDARHPWKWSGSQYPRAFSPSEEIPLLRKWNDSTDPRIRRLLVSRVAALLNHREKLSGEAWREIQAMKKRLLNDSDSTIRLYAAQRFLRENQEQLLAWIRKQEDPVRRDAALFFGTRERPWLREECERVLKLGDARSRWEAHKRLLELGESPESVLYLKNVSPRIKVQKSFRDFRTLWAAIEAYSIDYGQGLYELRCLTTPIAYISVMPHDPFQAKIPSYYRFFRPRKLYSWVLQGIGTDRRDEFTPLVPQLEVLATSSPNDFRKKARQSILPVCYDPTNGLLSSGDYLFVF